MEIYAHTYSFAILAAFAQLLKNEIHLGKRILGDLNYFRLFIFSSLLA